MITRNSALHRTAELMADNRERTVNDVAVSLGIHNRTAADALFSLSKSGLVETDYIGRTKICKAVTA